MWENEAAPFLKAGLTVVAKIGLIVAGITGAMLIASYYNYFASKHPHSSAEEITLIFKTVRIALAIWLNKTMVKISREPVLQPGWTERQKVQMEPAGHLCEPEDWDGNGIVGEDGVASAAKIEAVAEQMARKHVSMARVDGREHFAKSHVPSLKRVVDFGTVGAIAGMTRASFFLTASLADTVANANNLISCVPAGCVESTVFAGILAVFTAGLLKARKALIGIQNDPQGLNP